jgi:hypothetical protein
VRNIVGLRQNFETDGNLGGLGRNFETDRNLGGLAKLKSSKSR